MYKIIYQDGDIFNGGTADNSLWNQMPNKPIAELHYEYLGKSIVLKNYEAYNHLTKYMFVVSSQQQCVAAVIIMALKAGKIKRFIYDLRNNELLIDEVLSEKEYNNKPASGWKAGLHNLNVEFKII